MRMAGAPRSTRPAIAMFRFDAARRRFYAIPKAFSGF
jgi:hypothetical protein